jgi:hypothetical protein
VVNIDSRTASGGEMMTAAVVQNAEPGEVSIVGRGSMLRSHQSLAE